MNLQDVLSNLRCQTPLYIQFYGFSECFNTAMSDFTSGPIEEYVWCHHIADTDGYPCLQKMAIRQSVKMWWVPHGI